MDSGCVPGDTLLDWWLPSTLKTFPFFDAADPDGITSVTMAWSKQRLLFMGSGTEWPKIWNPCSRESSLVPALLQVCSYGDIQSRGPLINIQRVDCASSHSSRATPPACEISEREHVFLASSFPWCSP
ncbi:PREDICTED: uncharacterized protein LOC105589378 [Cercocebus atys]|uniref:uncharacterized protein LOC105589378 n=1 Tax=Cercocebus atys TaxID=9531 RepID=UPI0005F3C6BC|nr:PREDICTED: uncharacterized protein LOC105589378 [Cercocebus atys]